MEAPQDVRGCCAAVYASDWVRLLLGDSFHPGGTRLTEHLGRLLGLDARSRVLDVATGRGTSALHLARIFGCEVLGIDLAATSVEAAREAARTAGLDGRVRFEVGDAETLEVDGGFDAAICECAFCTFPDKAAAAAAMARAVRPGGRIGLGDLVRNGPLPVELEGLLAWVACVADALPLEGYRCHLEEAGFSVETVEDHRAVLAEMVGDIRTRLTAAELMARLRRVALPGADFARARAMARAAMDAVREGTLSYALLIGSRR